MKITGLFTILFLLPLVLVSQEERDSKKYQLSSFGADAAIFTSKWKKLTKDELQNISKGDFPFELHDSDQVEQINPNYGILQAGIELAWQSNQNPNREMRLSGGVILLHKDIANYNKINYLGTKTEDNGMGNPREVHAYLLQRYTMEYQAVQLTANLSNVYFTDRDQTFSFYTGYGLGLGATLNSEIIVKGYANEITLDNYVPDIDDYIAIFLSRVENVERLKAKTAYFLRPTIPFGMDLRLFKNKNSSGGLYWNFNSSVGMELRTIGSAVDGSPFFTLGSGITYRM